MDLEVLVNGDCRATCRPCHCALVLVDLPLRWWGTMLQEVRSRRGWRVRTVVDRPRDSEWGGKQRLRVRQAQYPMIRVQTQCQVVAGKQLGVRSLYAGGKEQRTRIWRRSANCLSKNAEHERSRATTHAGPNIKCWGASHTVVQHPKCVGRRPNRGLHGSCLPFPDPCQRAGLGFDQSGALKQTSMPRMRRNASKLLRSQSTHQTTQRLNHAVAWGA
jgi:hypothetical protein